MTTIELSNSYGYIKGLDNRGALYELKTELSYFVPGYQFSKAYRSGYWDPILKKHRYWDGRKELITKNLRFPAGLLYLVEGIFLKNKLQYKIIDKRKSVSFGKPVVVQKIIPYEYQKKTVEQALEEEGGVIQVATGGGKSAICCIITGMMNVKTMIYVHTKDLLYQMKENVENLLGNSCGQIGDGIIDIQRVTVATVQTTYRAYGKKYQGHKEERGFKETIDIKKHKKDIVKAVESAEVIFFDECHRLISDTFQLISSKSKRARYRYALSATAFRDDECDILVSAACGKKIVNVSASYLIENKFLVPPFIYMLKASKHRKRYSDYHTAYDDYIVENDYRNNLIVDNAIKAIEKNRRVLILIQKLRHGEILYDLLKEKYDVIYLQGKDDAMDRKHAINAMKDGDINCIIASTIFDEGVDIPILDTLILAGGGKSRVRAMQRVGRVLRKYPKKEKAYVIDFMDNATYLIKHSKERKSMYESERLFNVKVQK